MKIITFNKLEDLEEYLCRKLSSSLNKQVREKGRATLILPGGNSIKSLYASLISMKVPWQNISVGLSDERCVPSNHPMSNEKQLREEFLSYISGVEYLPLGEALLDHIVAYSPITLLSMGSDGHLASLFFNEVDSWKFVFGELYYTKKQNPNRISLTEKVLKTSQEIYILLIGNGKKNQKLYIRQSHFHNYLLSSSLILDYTK